LIPTLNRIRPEEAVQREIEGAISMTKTIMVPGNPPAHQTLNTPINSIVAAAKTAHELESARRKATSVNGGDKLCKMAARECTSRVKRKGLWSPGLVLLCRLKFRWWALLHSVLLGLRFFLELIAAAPSLTAKTLMRLTPRLPAGWAEQRKLLGLRWEQIVDSASSRLQSLRHRLTWAARPAKKVNHEMAPERFS
jgi:hypothetical protein